MNRVRIASMMFIWIVIASMIYFLSLAHPFILDRLFDVTPTPAPCGHTTVVKVGDGFTTVTRTNCP